MKNSEITIMILEQLTRQLIEDGKLYINIDTGDSQGYHVHSNVDALYMLIALMDVSSGLILDVATEIGTDPEWLKKRMFQYLSKRMDKIDSYRKTHIQKGEDKSE